MQNASSKKPARRKFTDAQKRQVLRDAAKMGVPKAAVKHDVHQSAVYSWKKGAAPGHEARPAPKLPGETYLLVRKVQGALRATRAQGGDLTDLEIYATLLVRHLIERGTP